MSLHEHARIYYTRKTGGPIEFAHTTITHATKEVLAARIIGLGFAIVAWESSQQPHPTTTEDVIARVCRLQALGLGWENSNVRSESRSKKPKPALPPEIWAEPVRGMDYLAAVRDMCRGNG